MAREIVARTGKVIGLTEYIDQQIAVRVEEVRDFQEQMAVLEGKIMELKDDLRELLEQKGAGWSDSAGYARLVSESVRTSYNTKGLDELILSEPLRYGWLKDFRRESSVRGGVQVK